MIRTYCLLCDIYTHTHTHTHTPLSEFLEWDAVGEALSADTNPLQNSITPQLIQNQVGGQLTSLRETGSAAKEGQEKEGQADGQCYKKGNVSNLRHVFPFQSNFLSVLISNSVLMSPPPSSSLPAILPSSHGWG